METPRRSWMPWVAAVLLLAAAPGALCQSCSSTTACPANTCCSTLAASPFSCVAGPFVNGVQVCSCKGLGAKGLRCPDDKPHCCGSNGLCVADIAQCPCVDSAGCPTGSCCSKAKAGWSSSTSIGTCSLAPFSADGKYCQCSTAAKLNGVTCPSCCKLDNRCAALSTACTCSDASQCPTGSCCSKTAAAWAAGTSGKCNTNPGTTGGTGAYCDCSYPLNGAACGSCCYDFKCAASMEACPCRDSSECVDIATNKQAGCCSKTLAQHTGNTDGKCSKQLVGGPSGDAFCDCADESLAPIGLSCPASSQPGPVVTCCAVSSKSWYPWWVGKCADSCPCDPPNSLNCPDGQCCSYTPEAGSGVCMSKGSDSSGNQVCPNCKSFSESGITSGCPPGKGICCPDGLCVASSEDCGCARDSDCPSKFCCNRDTNKCSASLFVTVNGVAKQVCKTCARAGMLCPEGTSYCCKNGKCAAKLEECTCRYASECQRNTCCARPPGTNAGKCSPTLFNATNFQVCPNCLRAKENGVSCPADKPTCCPDGTCAVAGTCGVKTACTSDSSCLTKQCCGSDGFCRTTLFSSTQQSCKDCNAAKNRGVLCPTTRPYCCPRGQCAAKAADCDMAVNSVKVSKYQAHHLYYLDALANLSAAADNNIWNGADYIRPSLDSYYDFRKFVSVGSPDTSGLPLLCDRDDYSTGTGFRGLDFKTAAGPLAWASDVAAQLWFAECSAMTNCKADLVKDKLTLAKMKLWTKAAADRMLSYLQIAPAGRNLLCPPRAFFGFFYQTFVRPPSPGGSFQGVFIWPTALNPSIIKIKNAAGADEAMSALQMLQRSAELKYYIPEPLLAMEGLIELIIGHDHSLLPTQPAPILPTSAPAAAPASVDGAPTAADGAAPEAAAAVALASTDAASPQATAPVKAMDAGPVADASYAENGFVAGIANPELLKHSAGTAWVAGCADGDLLCAAKSLGLLGANKAGAAPEGAVSQPAADGAQIMAGDRSCLTELRAQQGQLQLAKEMCGKYRPAGVWVDPDPAKRVFAIERPIWDIQVEKGNAIYTYVCSLAPDLVAKTCKVGQGGLEDYMERFKAVLATFASITCEPNVTSYVPVNALADGASFPLIEPGMATGGACLKMTANFISDIGCSLVDYLYDRYNKAVECCAGDCQTRPECALLSDGLVPRINIPSCGGDGEPATVLKMPTGFDLPATSGATCGGGDGKGYWGWGIWSG